MFSKKLSTVSRSVSKPKIASISRQFSPKFRPVFCASRPLSLSKRPTMPVKISFAKPSFSKTLQFKPSFAARSVPLFALRPLPLTLRGFTDRPFFGDTEAALENVEARRHDQELLQKLVAAHEAKERAMQRAKEAEEQINRAKEALNTLNMKSNVSKTVGLDTPLPDLTTPVTKQEFNDFKNEILKALREIKK